MRSAARFTFGAYLRDNLPAVALLVALGVVLYAMLGMLAVSRAGRILAVGLVVAGAVAALVIGFVRKRHFYDELQAVAAQVERAGIAPALLEEPAFLEGRLAYGALERLASLSNDELAQACSDAQDYRNYVELWVHEAKTPIAAMRLMVDGLHGEEANKLSVEIERMEALVDQALYYARSTSLAGDYRIRPISLAEACREACKKNARLLIQRGTTPLFELDEGTKVPADEMWIVFVIGQIIANSAKYGATTVRFTQWEEETGTPRERTVLQIADDGPGIPATDVQRVFDRGFTGENGHAQGRATGMGLFLVALLCERMGLGVGLGSEEGRGTRVVIAFPHDRRRANAQTGL